MWVGCGGKVVAPDRSGRPVAARSGRFWSAGASLAARACSAQYRPLSEPPSGPVPAVLWEAVATRDTAVSKRSRASIPKKPGPPLTFGTFIGVLFLGKALKRESGANPEQFPLL